jgi:hypothetical protein
MAGVSPVIVSSLLEIDEGVKRDVSVRVGVAVAMEAGTLLVACESSEVSVLSGIVVGNEVSDWRD